MSLAWFLPLSDGYGWVDVDGVYNFACSLREVLAKHPFLPHGCGLVSGSYFPSFSEGLSLRPRIGRTPNDHHLAFPFLFGGAFIEAICTGRNLKEYTHFPSFSEGLSLRPTLTWCARRFQLGFPFLFGGAFIEAPQRSPPRAGRCISLPFRRGFH